MTMEEYRKKKLDLYKKITGKKDFNKENACYLEGCIRCNGACCRNFPCSFSPDDFIDINNLEYMKKIIDTGYFIIANFPNYHSFNNDITYYIRPRGESDIESFVTSRIPMNNECIFHNIDGCMLDFYTRPSEGALLIPKKGYFGLGICSNDYSYEDLVSDWKKYQDVMIELVDYYDKREVKIKKPDNGRIYKLKKTIRKGE